MTSEPLTTSSSNERSTAPLLQTGENSPTSPVRLITSAGQEDYGKTVLELKVTSVPEDPVEKLDQEFNADTKAPQTSPKPSVPNAESANEKAGGKTGDNSPKIVFALEPSEGTAEGTRQNADASEATVALPTKTTQTVAKKPEEKDTTTALDSLHGEKLVAESVTSKVAINKTADTQLPSVLLPVENISLTPSLLSSWKDTVPSAEVKYHKITAPSIVAPSATVQIQASEKTVMAATTTPMEKSAMITSSKSSTNEDIEDSGGLYGNAQDGTAHSSPEGSLAPTFFPIELVEDAKSTLPTTTSVQKPPPATEPTQAATPEQEMAVSGRNKSVAIVPGATGKPSAERDSNSEKQIVTSAMPSTEPELSDTGKPSPTMRLSSVAEPESSTNPESLDPKETLVLPSDLAQTSSLPPPGGSKVPQMTISSMTPVATTTSINDPFDLVDNTTGMSSKSSRDHMDVSNGVEPSHKVLAADVTFRLTLKGNCSVVLDHLDEFKIIFTSILSRELEMDDDRIHIRSVSCRGDIIVMFTIHNGSDDAINELLVTKFIMNFHDTEIVSDSLMPFHSPSSDGTQSRKNSVANKTIRMVIYICVGATLGALLMIGLVGLIVSCCRRNHQQSFTLKDTVRYSS